MMPPPTIPASTLDKKIEEKWKIVEQKWAGEVTGIKQTMAETQKELQQLGQKIDESTKNMNNKMIEICTNGMAGAQVRQISEGITKTMEEKLEVLVREWGDGAEKQIDKRIEKNMDYIMERTVERLRGPIDQRLQKLEDGLEWQKGEAEKAEKRKELQNATEQTKMRSVLGKLEAEVKAISCKGLDKATQEKLEKTVETAELQQRKVEEAQRAIEKEREQLKKLQEEIKANAEKGGGGGGDTSGMVTIEEMRRLFDETRRAEDMEVNNVLLVHGLEGMSEEQRRTKLLTEMKKSMKPDELPTKFENPTIRGGGLAPIAFLHFPNFEHRKKATPIVNSLSGCGGRVKYGAKTSKLNQLLIAVSKDASKALFGPDRKPDRSEERARIRIDFRGISVSVDGKTVATRSGVDAVAVSDSKFKGENLTKALTF